MEEKLRGKVGENVEVMEEVGHSVSDKILSPAYKRFNSSSPLISPSDPAEAVQVSTCVFACVCNIQRIEKNQGREL